MNPISGIIIPVLTSDGTPDNSFGIDGQYCYDGTNHLMYGPKTAGDWGTGYSVGGGLGDGSAIGQLIFWNGSSWESADSRLSWDNSSYALSTNLLNFKADGETLYGVLEYIGGTMDVPIIYRNDRNYQIGFYDNIIYGIYNKGRKDANINLGSNLTLTPASGYLVICKNGLIISSGTGTSSNTISQIVFQSYTTAANRNSGIISGLWLNRTDASRTGKIIVSVSDYAADRTAIEIIADGAGTDTRIGDPVGGNYTQIEADGTIEFIGDATVWEDLNFDPDSGGGPAATLPDHVTINNVVHREFTSANNQLCGSVKEIPHNAKISGTVTYYPHLHMFLKSGESSGTTGVTFTIYWELRVSDGTTSGSVTLTATSTELTNNSHKFTVNDETGFTGSDELGAQLALTLKRTGGDAGDVIVTTYGIHYEMDTCGSRQKLAK